MTTPDDYIAKPIRCGNCGGAIDLATKKCLYCGADVVIEDKHSVTPFVDFEKLKKETEGLIDSEKATREEIREDIDKSSDIIESSKYLNKDNYSIKTKYLVMFIVGFIFLSASFGWLEPVGIPPIILNTSYGQMVSVVKPIKFDLKGENLTGVVIEIYKSNGTKSETIPVGLDNEGFYAYTNRPYTSGEAIYLKMYKQSNPNYCIWENITVPLTTLADAEAFAYSIVIMNLTDTSLISPRLNSTSVGA